MANQAHVPPALRGMACRYVPAGSRLLQEAAPGDVALRAAVFLDRDGILVEDVHFLRTPAQIRILPGVPEALRRLQDGFFIIVATNQSGVARGLFSEADLQEIHRELVRLLNAEGAAIDAIYACPHLPEAPLETYRLDCLCRKPNPGMLLQAQADWNLDLSRSVLVGDRQRDIEAGHGAGVRGILVSHTAADAREARLARDLTHAAKLILEGSPAATGHRT